MPSSRARQSPSDDQHRRSWSVAPVRLGDKVEHNGVARRGSRRAPAGHNLTKALLRAPAGPALITDCDLIRDPAPRGSPNICASPRAGAIVAWSTDQPVRRGPQRRAEPSGTYCGWFVWLARDHERSGSQRDAQRGHGNRHPAVLMDDPYNGAGAAGAALGSNRQEVLCSRQPRRPPAASRPTPPHGADEHGVEDRRRMMVIAPRPGRW